MWWKRFFKMSLILAACMIPFSILLWLLGIGQWDLATKIPQGIFMCVIFGVSSATAFAYKDKREAAKR